MVWESLNQDGAGWGVFGQRFARTGVRQATEFQVPVRTAGHERRASVAAAANGAFVAAWHGGPPASDGSQYGVFARRFSSAGNPLADEFQVNTYTTSFQMNASVATEANGDFVVAWESQSQDGPDRGIFARRFSSAGTPLAAEFQVNGYTAGDQRYPEAAMDADGDFVVVWQSYDEDGDSSGIFARRFSSAGAPSADELQVNAYTSTAQTLPSVAMAASGDFVIVWQSASSDDYSSSVFAQRFSSAGTPLATEFKVHAFTAGPQVRPSVRAQANGDFVVAWDSQFQDSSNYGIFARRFSSDGLALDAEFQVNTYATSEQRYEALAIDSNGDFVVAWESADGSETGVFAQRFGPPDFDVDGNGSNDALTDGLLVLRYLFGFRGATLITGAVGAGCTRCDATAIETDLAGITK